MAGNWAKLKVVDLKAELKRRGLPQNGLKGELIARLEAADEEGAQPEQGGEAPAEENDEQLGDDAKPDVDDGVEERGDAPQQVEERTEPAEAAAEDEATDTAEKTDEPTPPAAVATPPAEKMAPGDGETQTTADDVSKRESGPIVEAEVEAGAEATAEATVDTRMDEDVPPEPATEGSQKRKERSASPAADEDESGRKRVRTQEPMNGETLKSGAMDNDIQTAVEVEDGHVSRAEKAEDMVAEEEEEEQDLGYNVAPAVHPATSALYISNLMRPLRADDVQAHLASLASRSPSSSSSDVVVQFHLDQIRTHAFAVFRTTAAASRVRASLHDRVWPNESNRKSLWVDFVPPAKVSEWIAQEESNGNGRGTRWEVVYRDGPDGVEASLQTTGSTGSAQHPPPLNHSHDDANHGSKNSNNSSNGGIPLGPRARDINPPTGPRAVRPGTGPGPRPPLPNTLGTVVERTRSRPPITYQLVPEDMAQRRVANMRSFYSRDTQRDLGREINRYSFEEGESFVDRGKEVFEGIRPPHRERAIERERRGGGARPPRRGPPPPFRPRSDRYLPGREGGADDRRYDERASRYGDWERRR